MLRNRQFSMGSPPFPDEEKILQRTTKMHLKSPNQPKKAGPPCPNIFTRQNTQNTNKNTIKWWENRQSSKGGPPCPDPPPLTLSRQTPLKLSQHHRHHHHKHHVNSDIQHHHHHFVLKPLQVQLIIIIPNVKMFVKLEQTDNQQIRGSIALPCHWR